MLPNKSENYTSKKGCILAECLMSIAILTIAASLFLVGISAACRVYEATSQKNSSDVLAEAYSEYIKNALRFARDTDAAEERLKGFEAALNGLTAEGLIFEREESGDVRFGFSVGKREYSYKTTPLNDSGN